MAQPWLLRPLSAGFLAVSVDMSLDPIAECFGYWKWKDPPALNYYGVPFDNFLGWFAIVASFSLLTRAGFRWVKPGVKWSSFWVPPLAGLVALLVMALLQAGIGYLYSHVPGGQTTVFVVVLGLAALTAWSYLVHSRRDQRVSWPILAVPLVMELLLIALLFLTRSFEQLALTSLIVALPTNLLASFFGFAWASIDGLFPSQSAPGSG